MSSSYGKLYIQMLLGSYIRPDTRYHNCIVLFGKNSEGITNLGHFAYNEIGERRTFAEEKREQLKLRLQRMHDLHCVATHK